MKSPGRFRKGKKAYKNGEGCPVWWHGSHKNKKLQIRYCHFILSQYITIMDIRKKLNLTVITFTT